MNTIKKLSLIPLALALVACNEKVSPELQGASSSTTGGTIDGPVIIPDQYYLRVVNTADTMLNYKLHKSGSGNGTSRCEITSNTKFSSERYAVDPTPFDITCFYEAEELALFYNGPSFAIEASKNTCEYVKYSPYSYFAQIPGDSSQNVTFMDCTDSLSQAFVDAEMTARYGDNFTCGFYYSTTRHPTAPRAPEAALELNGPEDLCHFNYSRQDPDQPNCDIGKINFTTYSAVPVDSDSNGVPDGAKVTRTTRTVDCGGRVYNCRAGAVTQESIKDTPMSSIMTRATPNADYKKDYKYAAPITKAEPNIKYANFRRDLASPNIEFGNSNRGYGTPDSSDDQQLSNYYMSSFGDPLYRFDYNPGLALSYANNQRMDGSRLVSSTQQTNASEIYTGGTAIARPLAADPFIGLSLKAEPFYTFDCLDGAYETKAKIKFVLRDWDRELPAASTSSLFERISDVDGLPPLARQDVPYTFESTNDPDSWNAYNDLYDWDDIIDMERFDGGAPYDPTITIWRPYPIGDFDTGVNGTNGFFNPAFFPGK